MYRGVAFGQNLSTLTTFSSECNAHLHKRDWRMEREDDPLLIKVTLLSLAYWQAVANSMPIAKQPCWKMVAGKKIYGEQAGIR